MTFDHHSDVKQLILTGSALTQQSTMAANLPPPVQHPCPEAHTCYCRLLYEPINQHIAMQVLSGNADCCLQTILPRLPSPARLTCCLQVLLRLPWCHLAAICLRPFHKGDVAQVKNGSHRSKNCLALLSWDAHLGHGCHCALQYRTEHTTTTT
jgi:hypothetical protein